MLSSESALKDCKIYEGRNGSAPTDKSMPVTIAWISALPKKNFGVGEEFIGTSLGDLWAFHTRSIREVGSAPRIRQRSDVDHDDLSHSGRSSKSSPLTSECFILLSEDPHHLVWAHLPDPELKAIPMPSR